MIPKVFHQIWIGGKMPDSHKFLRDRMLSLHPHWDYKLWTEENFPVFYNQDIYDKFEQYCFKSDVARYEIILRHGGVYIDTDFLFLKNIDIFTKNELFATREYRIDRIPNINNCIIGIEKNHELMKYIVLKIRQSYEDNYKKLFKEKGWHAAGLCTVGPVFFDTMIREFSPELEEQALPMKYFCPFRGLRMPGALYEKYPDAYAIHLWNHRVMIDFVDFQKMIEINLS